MQASSPTSFSPLSLISRTNDFTASPHFSSPGSTTVDTSFNSSVLPASSPVSSLSNRFSSPLSPLARINHMLDYEHSQAAASHHRSTTTVSRVGQLYLSPPAAAAASPMAASPAAALFSPPASEIPASLSAAFAAAKAGSIRKKRASATEESPPRQRPGHINRERGPLTPRSPLTPIDQNASLTLSFASDWDSPPRKPQAAGSFAAFGSPIAYGLESPASSAAAYRFVDTPRTCPAAPKGNKKVKESTLTSPISGKNFKIDSLVFRIAELAHGDFHRAYLFEENQPPITFDGHVIPTSQLIIKEAYMGESSASIEETTEKAVQAYTKLHALAEQTKEFSVPHCFVKPGSLNATLLKTGNVWLLERISKSIHSFEWLACDKDVEFFIKTISKDAQQCLRFAKRILTKMANEGMDNPMMSSSDSSFFIDDFKPKNVMYNKIEATFEPAAAAAGSSSVPETYQFHVIDFSSEHTDENLAFCLNMYVKEWSSYSKASPTNPYIYDWLVADFPSNVKTALKLISTDSLTRLEGEIETIQQSDFEGDETESADIYTNVNQYLDELSTDARPNKNKHFEFIFKIIGTMMTLDPQNERLNNAQTLLDRANTLQQKVKQQTIFSAPFIQLIANCLSAEDKDSLAKTSRVMSNILNPQADFSGYMSE